MIQQKLQLVMFDLDGTLVDSVPDIAIAVDCFGMFFLRKYETGPWTSQSFVSCRRDIVGDWHGIIVDLCSDQSSIVCHVDHQLGSAVVGDICELVVIDLARIGTRACYDQLWLVLAG